MMMMQRAPPPSITPFWEAALEGDRERERERKKKLRSKYSRNFTQIVRSKNYAYTFPTRLG
jgi:hypothetical protein